MRQFIEPSHLDLCCLQNLLLSPVAVKELRVDPFSEANGKSQKLSSLLQMAENLPGVHVSRPFKGRRMYRPACTSAQLNNRVFITIIYSRIISTDSEDTERLNWALFAHIRQGHIPNLIPSVHTTLKTTKKHHFSVY